MTLLVNRSSSKLMKAEGFSLTEMLVTTLILALAAALMATGIPAAINAYQRVVKTSNAQLALSTTISALRSELGLATDVRVASGEIFYYSESEGCWVSVGNPESSDYRGLVKQYYKGMPTPSTPVSSLAVDGDPIPLVSNEAIATTNVNDALTVELEEEDHKDPKRPDNSSVDVTIVVTDASGNQLAAVGDDDSQYRILTRFAE